MKFDYSTVVNALRQEADTQANLQPLRNDRCNPLFFCHPKPTNQVFLLFHTFTASPDQLRDVGYALFEAGYNVVIPLLPGHGLQGTWSCASPPPLPLHRRVYEEFALRWLKRSRILGDSIALGGVGTGATLATGLAAQCPSQIQRLLLLDPYMPSASSSPHPLLPYQLVTTTQTDATGEPYWQWIIPRQAETLAGYDGFPPRSLEVWFELAQEVWKRSQVSPLPPVLVVGSERERALADETSRLFCEYVRQYQPKAWHLYYNLVLDLSHALLSALPEVDSQYLARLIQQYAKLEITSDPPSRLATAKS
ncbi:MAG: hypothetical protein RLZZ435_312 [Cyanobacteriota bacterium]|jgi:pimeloyl-ACP methyl ester carboxylesterase